MQHTVKLACRGSLRKPHDVPNGRMLKPRFRHFSNGAQGWQVLGGSGSRSVHITGAMLWGDATLEDYRHEFVCEGCGNKLDRLGDKLISRLDQAREAGEKVLFLDQLQR
jgi:hypothetical protein